MSIVKCPSNMPRIIKKLQKSRYIEEILGGIGLAYVISLVVLGYFLITFLASVIADVSSLPQEAVKSTVGYYDIPAALEATR
jgi:hypothetical protein